MNELSQFDPEVLSAIQDEVKREEFSLEMIASENSVSLAVMQAQGSLLTNKYAEGYPGKRYYNGCENVDVVENLAIERAKQLFGADHANVQPHSGSGANMAVYFSVLKPGDTILALSLDHGGHLTHGHKMNFTGSLYNVVSYGVRKEDDRIDYDQMHALAKEHKPQMIVGGASAYSRIIDFDKMRAIADEVGAYLFIDMAHIAGLVAAGLHPNPVPVSDFVTTTTHKTLRGPRGGMILCKEEFAKKVNSRVFPGIQGGPLMHVIAGKAVAFKEALQPEFKTYAQQVIKNAQALSDELIAQGLRICSGGTDNHLLLVDLRPKDVTGRDAADYLHEAGITVNKNMIPFDEQPPVVCSGVRIGTPAITTRGLKEAESKQVGQLIAKVLDSKGDAKVVAEVRGQVETLCKQFPLYPELQENSVASSTL